MGAPVYIYIGARTSIISCPVDSMRALPQWLLAALRGLIDFMRALPQWLLAALRIDYDKLSLPLWLLTAL